MSVTASDRPIPRLPEEYVVLFNALDSTGRLNSFPNNYSAWSHSHDLYFMGDIHGLPVPVTLGLQAGEAPASGLMVSKTAGHGGKESFRGTEGAMANLDSTKLHVGALPTYMNILTMGKTQALLCIPIDRPNLSDADEVSGILTQVAAWHPIRRSRDVLKDLARLREPLDLLLKRNHLVVVNYDSPLKRLWKEVTGRGPKPRVVTLGATRTA